MDYSHPLVVEFAEKHGHGETKIEKSIKLYLAVRDGFRYDPFHVNLSTPELRASSLVKRGSGFCVEKANLLAATARYFGIPSRLGFANVRNHIGVNRLVELLGTDILVMHGYAELFLNEKWVKATPAFNKKMCEKLNVAPLDFNGRDDSIFQEFDPDGNNFMEYVKDHGQFDDIPRDLMISEIRDTYPHFFKDGGKGVDGMEFLL